MSVACGVSPGHPGRTNVQCHDVVRRRRVDGAIQFNLIKLDTAIEHRVYTVYEYLAAGAAGRAAAGRWHPPLQLRLDPAAWTQRLEPQLLERRRELRAVRPGE